MVTPYYSDDQVTLYHGKALEIDAWLTADVLITDPPYGTGTPGRHASYGREQLHRDITIATRAAIANDDSTETRDAVLAAWGSRPAMVFASPRLPEPPGQWVDRLVWDKKRPGMNGGPWRYQHESIYATAGFVRTSNNASSIIVAFPDQTDHIHAKPLAVMTRLVAAAPPGVIADPFAGSGSTLVAAKQLGRHSIGVELDEAYCELIAKRLAQDVLPLAM